MIYRHQPTAHRTMRATRRLRALAGLWLASCAMLLVAFEPAAAQPVRRGVARPWAMDSLVLLDSMDATVRWPSLAEYKGTIAIAADMFRRDEGAGNEPFGVLAILPGRNLPLPTGGGLGFPKLIYDNAGVLHLFWADFSKPKSSMAAWSSAVRTIWHARWNGIEWTEPERVATGLSVDWRADGSQLAVDSEGTVHALLTVLDSTDFALFDYRNVANTWSRQRVSAPALGASLAASAANRLTAVYVAALNPESAPEVLFSESSDAGRSWSKPMVLLAHTSTRESRMPRVVRSHKSLVAMWVASTAAGGDALYAARSYESGSWRALGRVQLEGDAARLVTTHTSCTGVSAFLELRSAAGRELRSHVTEVQVSPTGALASSELLPSDGTLIEIGASSTPHALVVAGIVAGNAARARHTVLRRSVCR